MEKFCAWCDNQFNGKKRDKFCGIPCFKDWHKKGLKAYIEVKEQLATTRFSLAKLNRAVNCKRWLLKRLLKCLLRLI